MLQPSVQARPRIDMAFAPDPTQIHEVLDDWQALVAEGSSLYALYQSPQWFEHLRHTEPADRLLLTIARDDVGRTVGVVPVQVGRHDLLFEGKSRLLWKSPLKTAFILGSQPLLPPDDGLHDALFRSLHERLSGCDAVYLHCVPTDSFLWSYLQRSPSVRQQFLFHLPAGVRPFHAIALPGSYGDYLAQFGKKKRYNLKRQVRLLREHGAGQLDLERIATPGQVSAFTGAVEELAQKSWQPDARDLVEDPAIFYRKLADLAERDLLRSYVLRCAGQACAYVLGYQFRGVYHYANVGYDQALKAFSPGTVLLWLLLEDLFAHVPPQLVNFGIGHSRYKEEFGNLHSEDASVLLLRKTPANRLRRGCHATFRSLRGLARQLLRRPAVEKEPAASLSPGHARAEECAEPSCQSAPGLPS
jgi:CelD/BcsL family acetyltransferase involved in cellulose biosynthesis